MKKKWIGIILGAALALALIGCEQQMPQATGEALLPQATLPAPESGAEESKLTVNATETVKAAPDIAYVYIGAQSSGATAEEAQQKNAAVADAFLNAIRQQGVQEEDIETSNINIYEDYDKAGNYIMDNTYKVTIREIDKVGAVIDAATAAGANSTYSLSFDLQDRDSIYIEALGKAMQSIDAKAKAVAASGGYEIVRPLSIEENGGSGYYPMVEAAAMDTAAGGGMATPVTPGEIEVSASVSGTYVIA